MLPLSWVQVIGSRGSNPEDNLISAKSKVETSTCVLLQKNYEKLIQTRRTINYPWHCGFDKTLFGDVWNFFWENPIPLTLGDLLDLTKGAVMFHRQDEEADHSRCQARWFNIPIYYNRLRFWQWESASSLVLCKAPTADLGNAGLLCYAHLLRRCSWRTLDCIQGFQDSKIPGLGSKIPSLHSSWHHAVPKRLKPNRIVVGKILRLHWKLHIQFPDVQTLWTIHDHSNAT